MFGERDNYSQKKYEVKKIIQRRNYHSKIEQLFGDDVIYNNL